MIVHYTLTLFSAKIILKIETSLSNDLLEDLSVSPWVLLAVNDKWLLPGPLLVDELSVLWLAGVKLGELVALIVRGDIESWESLLTTDDESTLDDAVVGGTVDGSTSEDVLAGSLKTSEETTDQVGGHEDLSKLIIVLVVNSPQGVFLSVEVLPEPLEGIGGLLVRVLTLPLIERNGGLCQRLERVLCLWCSWGFLLLLLDFLGLWLGSLLLWLLGLWCLSLLWCLVLESWLVDQSERFNNSGVDWLVVDGSVPTGSVWVLSSPLLVEEELETTGDDTSSKQIGKSDTLTGEVGVVQEVLLNDGDALGSGLDGVIDVLLVVWVTAHERTEPTTEGCENLRVEERHPLQDRSIVLLGLTEEGGLLVLGGDCKSCKLVTHKTKQMQDNFFLKIVFRV